MHYWEMADQAETISRKAFEFLTQHGLSPTPANYELCFHYAVGQNAQLVSALNDALANPDGPQAEDLKKIFERFCTQNQSNDTVSDVGIKIQDELKKLASILENAGQDTGAYGKTLNALATQIDRVDAAQLKTLVAGVAAATRAMEARNRNLETQLANSSEEVKTLRTRIEAIKLESLTDPLTNLANRKCFDQKVEEAVAEALAEGQDLCVLMGDVDHFKKFNDTWGHATGDQVLRLVAQCFKANTKGKDTAARYGGEEFIVVLPATGLSNAAIVANQIRLAVESKKIVKRSTGETLGAIAVSIGAAQYQPGESISDLINRADACLYAAKRTGRNRVVTEDQLEQINSFGGVVTAA